MEVNNQKNNSAFDNLPPKIQEWLTSDTVAAIIIELNQKYGVDDSGLHILPRAITRLAVGKTMPQNFSKEVYARLPFLEPEQISKLSEEVKDRVFKPIARQLKSDTGIDASNLNTAITEPTNNSSEMKIEKGMPRTVNLKGAKSQGEQGANVSAPSWHQPPKQTQPQTNRDESDQPFHLTEQAPSAPQNPQNQPPENQNPK